MKPVRVVESRYAAIWKSAVTEVLAGQAGNAGNAAAIDSEHPILAGTDRYCDAFAAGDVLDPPTGKKLRDDDPEVTAFLAQLHHRLGHAMGTGNAELQRDLERQLATYIYGNPLWQQMSQQYFAYYGLYPTHKGAAPLYRSWNASNGGGGRMDYGAIAWRLPADATVALIGDIGTGTDVAAAVLLAALSFKPHAILHVGDVYFSGTRFEFAHRFVGMIDAVMKAAGQRVPIFTVPGNHEYFTGNIAYFECLDSGKLTPLPEQRQRASYFSLKTADDGWQFLGMDTGYYGHYFAVSADQQRVALQLLHRRDKAVPTDLPAQTMMAAPDVVVLRDDEAQWQRAQIEAFRGQSVLLSHHPLYSASIPCGAKQRMIAGKPDPTDINREWVDTAMWRQLGRYFGDRVPAWFWGHEHNLNIFQNAWRPADWPATGEMNALFRTLPAGRCIGHSAIPVRETENPYAQHYPVPLKTDALTLGLTGGWYNHGFEILQLAGAGKPARARYYQIADADPTPLLLHEEEIGGR